MYLLVIDFMIIFGVAFGKPPAPIEDNFKIIWERFWDEFEMIWELFSDQFGTIWELFLNNYFYRRLPFISETAFDH